MGHCQNSTLTGFHITAFTASRPLAVFVFTIFLLMYMTAVMGNVIIATLICKAPHLHTPMYFFLGNLSIIDATYVSTILPKLLSIILTANKKISFHGCLMQLYFYIFCADVEILILTSMAYDRYVAVCTPLHYSRVMKKWVCIVMATFSWFVSAINSLMYACLTASLSFCYVNNVINNFFCEIRSLMALSSSDTSSMETILLVEDFCLAFSTFLLILISYICIFSAVLKVHSTKSRLKVFSSCTSHLTTVILFYGPLIFLYMKPQSENSKDQDKLISLLYMAVVPTLNPFVYTLRNKEVKEAIVKAIHFI